MWAFFAVLHWWDEGEATPPAPSVGGYRVRRNPRTSQ